jgi:uncharacterized protein YdeI (YjbR/CyaY-like superfamily)
VAVVLAARAAPSLRPDTEWAKLDKLARTDALGPPRQEAGVDAGDTVEVKLELDTAPRHVEVPEVLAKALAEDSKARAAFDRLAFTYRKEYVRWINEAKRDETRQRRVTQALEALRQGKTRT